MTTEAASSWPALLAHWTAFAQAAKSLPADGDGPRWKDAVPSIIGLQAVTFALADLDRLAPDERRLGLDKAAVLIRGHAAQIHELWRGERVPDSVRELIDDAFAALKAAKDGGTEWCVGVGRLLTDHPADLIETLLGAGFAGDLFVPTPGVPIFAGCPAVFARGLSGGVVQDRVAAVIERFFECLAEPRRVPQMRQAYRQFDFARGRAVRDFVVPMDAELPGGQPLLVPAILGGKAQGVTLPIKGAAEQAELPLVFASS